MRAAAIYAVAGAAAGAVNSAIYGGNVGQGALYGAIGGAIGGAAGVAAAGVGEEIYQITLTLATAGVTGGIMAELSGAKFSEGMLTAMLAAGMAYGMGKLAMEISEANAAKGAGGGSCPRSKCMDPDQAPPEELARVSIEDILGGEARQTSPYGPRRLGSRHFHGGADYVRESGSDWGDPIFAPSNGSVVSSNARSGFIFRPAGWPARAYLQFIHTSTGLSAGTNVLAGANVGNLANVACGRCTGPHIHVQFHYGRRLYNPTHVLR